MNSQVIREGPCRFKEDGLRSFLWSKRWLVLQENVLTLYKSETSNSLMLIVFLAELEKVERTDTYLYSLELVTRDKVYHISFKDDNEVYCWLDELYIRSQKGISPPTNFSHNLHVGVNTNQEVVGLPNAWSSVLNTSKLTQEDITKHPQAVKETMEFLDYYTQEMRAPISPPSKSPSATKYLLDTVTHGLAYPKKQLSKFASTQSFTDSGIFSKKNRNNTIEIGPPNPAIPPTLEGMNLQRHKSEKNSQKIQISLPRKSADGNELRKYSSDVNLSPRTSGATLIDSWTNSPDLLAQYPISPIRKPVASPAKEKVPPVPNQIPPQIPPIKQIPKRKASITQATAPLEFAKPALLTPNSAQEESKSAKIPSEIVLPVPTETVENTLIAKPTLKTIAESMISKSSVGSPSNDSTPVSDKLEKLAINVNTLDIEQAPETPIEKIIEIPAVDKEVKKPNLRISTEVKTNDFAANFEYQTVTPRDLTTLSEEELLKKIGKIVSYVENMVSKGNPTLLYTKVKPIGRGASSKVFIAKKNDTGQQYALKQMVLHEQKYKENVVEELLMLKALKHPNVVNYIDSYYLQGDLWIILELMEGGPLNDIIENYALTEDNMRTICYETAKGIKFLHECNIIHRDIKSDNILLGAKGTVKLIDFGFSAKLETDDSKRETLAGTAYWMAPEVIKHKGKGYCNKIDVWSFGIVIVEMVDGQPPYMEEDFVRAIYLIVTNGAPKIKNIDKYSTGLQDLLEQCLEVNVDKRISSADLVQVDILKNAPPVSTLAMMTPKPNRK
ncbi:Protein kinase [Boothiomyces sp. JEL0838]|nr:Protein kinase [Boothiomyces sp. JEL0838]